MRIRELLTLLTKSIILFALITFFIFHITPAYEQNYTAALTDKIEKMKSIDTAKIVLIGNSNLAFGIDSEKIEQAFKMPVINMGLHGGLGNAFHEEMAKLNISAGDIYIICHTDYFDNDTLEDGVLAWTTIENKRNLWNLLRKRDIPVMIDAFPAYLKKCIRLWEEDTDNEIPGNEYYRRNSFNSYGDIGVKRENSELNSLGIEATEYCPRINDICMYRLNTLNSYINANGACMVVAGYPIIVKERPSAAFLEALSVFQAQLEAQLECTVISDFTEYCYDESYFFDTVYHLTDAGVALRTEQLIKDLGKITTFKR